MEAKDAKSSNVTARLRVKLAFGVLGILMFALIGRVVDLSVNHHQEYTEIAAMRTIRTTPLPHERGRILSSDGQVLAQSIFSGSSVYINVRQVLTEDLRDVAKRLGDTLSLDSSALFAKLVRHRNNAGLPIKIFLESHEAKITKDLIDSGLLPGVHFRTRVERVYPKGQLAAPVVGFTNVDQVGSGGIELSFDSFLKGRDGELVSRVDARRRSIHDNGVVESDPVDGADVHLTIDATIQGFTEDALANLMNTWEPEYATAIVMESRTGRILAMANVPTFDPNTYFKADANSRNNFALTSAFEPGSVFKPLILAIAIEQGILQPDSTIEYKHSVRALGRSISDLPHPIRDKDRSNQFGEPEVGAPYVTAEMGIVKSSNTMANWVASCIFAGKKIDTLTLSPGEVVPYDGNGRLDAYLRAFGFGERTGIDIGGGRSESRGNLPNDDEWNGVGKGNKLAYVISQLIPSVSKGYQAQVTSLQMLNAFNSIATGGIRMRPYVVERVVARDGSVLQQQRPEIAGDSGFSPATAETMRQMLKRVVSPDGTARRAFSDIYTLAGKTGTAELIKKQEDGTWKYSSDHHQATFIGFAPADDPKLTILITARDPSKRELDPKGKPYKTYGGNVAAPYVKKIMEQSLRYLDVPSDRIEADGSSSVSRKD